MKHVEREANVAPASELAPVRRARVHTRTALIDAAETIFLTRGTISVSIDEICTTAGFTRGAFYSNFRTVDDVFFALYERKTAAVLSGMGTLGAHLPEPDGRTETTFAAATDEMLRAIPADTEWYALRAMFGMRVWTDPEKSAALRAHGEDFRRQVVPVLERVARAVGGTLTPDADEASRIVVACHVGAVLQAPFVDEPSRLRRDAMLTALRGVIAGS